MRLDDPPSHEETQAHPGDRLLRCTGSAFLATQQPPSNLDLLELVAGDDPDWLVRAWAMVGTAVGGRSRRAAQVADLVVPDEQRHLLAFRALALTAIASPLGPPQTVEALGLIAGALRAAGAAGAPAVAGTRVS